MRLVQPRFSAAVVLAVSLGLVMLLTIGINGVVSWRCVDTLQVYIEQQDTTIEDVPVFCDTTAEIELVLDIGLALAGGLVGWLAGTEALLRLSVRREDEA